MANIVHHARPILHLQTRFQMRHYFMLVVLLAACAGNRDAVVGKSEISADSVGASSIGAATPAAGATATGSTASTGELSAELLKLRTDPRAAIRGLYVNRFAAQSKMKMAKLIAIADSTEINAFVIDIKDEFGLNYNSDDPMVQKNGGTETKIRDLKTLLDTLNAHGILPIARLVVFKDSVAARLNPQFTIRKPDGSAWRDRKGLTWVNPYSNTIWEYNFRVAEEAVRLGFGEVQWDYIRFPEPYKSLPQQIFPEANGRSKPAALSEFLDASKKRLDKLGVRTTADIFGLTTTVGGALEVGQKWEPLVKSVDVVLPMVYPSHYPRGSFGIARPNADPYNIIHIAISRGRERTEAMGLSGERVRPWLQAFDLGQPRYGAHEIREQKRAVYDSGYEGWVLWHPGSKYDHVLPALEKTLVPRAKKPPVPARKMALD